MNKYFKKGIKLLKKVNRINKANIDYASDLMAQVHIKKGKIFVFGAGHSHLFASELFYRAGGLSNIEPIYIEPLMLHQGALLSSHYEKQNDYVQNFLIKYNITKQDLLLVISTSGKNPAAIDVALWAKQKQAKIIVITSKNLFKQTKSLHQSGKFLKDFGLVVIDNLISYGDIALSHGHYNFGSYSTLVGIALVQTLLTETIIKVIKQNQEPEIWTSGNTKNGNQKNQKYLTYWQKKIFHL